jgi:hypothetical protein
MAQSHKFCDHPGTKSARAKCRREREATGQSYQGGWEEAHARGQDYCPYCGTLGGGHQTWCSHHRAEGTSPRRCRECGAYGWHANWCSRVAGPGPTTDIVANDNGGFRVSRGWKGQENTAADDAARPPTHRRIVQLERKAAATTIHEAAACMAAALRLRTREGLVGQVI